MKNIIHYLLLLIIAITFGHFWGASLGENDLAFYALGVFVPLVSLILFISPIVLSTRVALWFIYVLLGVLNVSCALLLNYLLERSMSGFYIVAVAGILVFSLTRVWQYSKLKII